MTTFALPNLQGAAPLGVGQGPGLSDRELGDTGGEMAVTLLQSEMAAHSHAALADATSSAQTSPAGNTWGSLPGRTPPPRYATAPLDALMSPFALYTAGSSVPHNNMSPYLTLTFIIALQGLFPQRP
jgi:microcystin-dependent protein